MNAPFDRPRAEDAYLFRHALLRDAAYQLQLPGDRARLHALAFALIEDLFGGRPPELPLEGSPHKRFKRHPTDPHAMDLAEHARLAGAGDFVEAQRIYLRRAADYNARLFQNSEALRAWLALSELLTGARKGEAVRRAALLVGMAGRGDEAEELLKRAIAIHREAGDRRAEGITLSSLGLLQYERGQVEPSMKLYEDALAMHREVGDRRSEGIALGHLASAYLVTGRLAQAQEFFERALVIDREFKDEAANLGNLAVLFREMGRKQEADRLQRRAMALFRKSGRRRNEGIVWINLAILRHEELRFPEAERGYTRALSIFREVGDPRHEALTLGNLAVLQQSCERHEEAAQTYLRGMALQQETGNRRGFGMILGNYGKLLKMTGKLPEARRALEEAIAIHREFSNKLFLGSHTCSLALLLLAEGRQEEARAEWKRGAELLGEAGSANELERIRIDMWQDCEAARVPSLDEPATGEASASR